MLSNNFGFIKEAIRIGDVLSAGKKAVNKLKWPSRFKSELNHPFGKSRKWKDLPNWQKARVVGGIGMNASLGVIPAAAGIKNLATKSDYKKKYEDLKSNQDTREKALKSYYGY